MKVIVTRHQALLEFLKEKGVITGEEPVVTHVSDPGQIRGCHVIGVLPLALAAEAASVTEVTLALPPELRGKELNIEEMRKHAGPIVTYRVTRVQ